MRRVSHLVMAGRGTGRGLGIVRLVSDTLKDMEANKEPLSFRKFSGNVAIRTTPEMHRQLAILSAEAGVSLNRYVNSRLL